MSITRKSVKKLVESNKFQHSIIVLIIINAIILGVETSKDIYKEHGTILKSIDLFILKIFVLEIILRLYAYGFGFFKRAWSVFDFIVVAIALVPASEAFAALRALRILRVLRLISAIPSMRRVVEGLITSIPGIASVASIMLLIFYVFAVIGTHLFSATFPQWFGSLGETMFTLFQVMTLESWSMGIVRPVMEVHTHAWIFFVLYILVTTFTMLNLFIAIIVNAMHQDADEDAEESRIAMRKEIKTALEEMEQRIVIQIKSKK